MPRFHTPSYEFFSIIIAFVVKINRFRQNGDIALKSFKIALIIIFFEYFYREKHAVFFHFSACFFTFFIFPHEDSKSQSNKAEFPNQSENAA